MPGSHSSKPCDSIPQKLCHSWRLYRRPCIVNLMPLSARNQLRGQVKDVKLGNVMAHIVMQVGDNEIESVITRRSAEEMNLKVGYMVTAIIKSTEVMIQK